MNILKVAAIVACSLFANNTLAHDFWIQPSKFHPKKGRKVEFKLYFGEDLKGNSIPRVNAWFNKFELHLADKVKKIEGKLGDDPAGGAFVTSPGLSIAVYDSKRQFSSISPERFNNYLKKEGLEFVLAERERLGESDIDSREYFLRQPKALIKTKNGEGGVAYDKVIGLVLEMIPNADPYKLGIGDDLTITILHEDKPLENALVKAYSELDVTDKQLVRTDSDGNVTIKLDKDGQWIASVVHIVRLPEGTKGAEWESYWASLTFDRSGK